jgi:hypothetical protein
MNKLLQKVAKLTLGLAMAAGVGVAVGAGHKDIAQVRAETVTVSPGDITGWTSSQAAQSGSASGINFVSTGGADTTQIRFYSGATHTFTSTIGNITKAEFTCTASGTSNYGPGKMSLASGSAGSYSYSGKVGTWTGDSATFSLTGGQARCTSIVFTYTADATTEATGISFSPASVTVNGGLSGSFTPTLTGGSGAYEKTISWSSSNTTVLPNPSDSEDGEVVNFSTTNPSVNTTVTLTASVASPGKSDIGSISITVNHVAEHTITYDANGGTGSMSDSINVVSANTFTAPSGMEFKEWNTEDDGSGTPYAAGDTVSDDTDLYAIWQRITYRTGFESSDGFTAGSNYQLTVTDGPANKQWTTYYGVAATSNTPITGDQSMQMRYYSTSTALCYTQMDFDISEAHSISFKAKSNASNATIKVYYSTNQGSSWTLIGSSETLSTSVSDVEEEIPSYVSSARFKLELNADKPSSGNKYCLIDDVVIETQSATPTVTSVTLSPAEDVTLKVGNTETYTVTITGTNLTGSEVATILYEEVELGSDAVSLSTTTVASGGTFVVTAVIADGAGELSATCSGITSNVVTIYTEAAKTLSTISVDPESTGSTSYFTGDVFSKTGFIIKANYTDSTSSDVTATAVFELMRSGSPVSISSALATTDTTVRVSYTESGKTETVNITIEVIDDYVETLSWGNRGTVDCFEGTTLGNAVTTSSWTFTATWASGATTYPTFGTGSGQVHIGLYSTSAPESESSALNTSYAFSKNDDQKYLVACYEGAFTASNTNRKIAITDLLNAINVETAASFGVTNSISVGDTVYLAAGETYNVELNGTSTTSTKYGIATAYTDEPAKLDPLTVCEGSSSGTFAFKDSSDKYLYWGSGNSLNRNATLNANTSWNVSFSSGNASIVNASDSTRSIRYNANSGQERFACYQNGGQQNVQLWKNIPAGQQNIANTNLDVQKVVVSFAKTFNDIMNDTNVCSGDYSQRSTAWGLVTDEYDSLFGSETSLDSSQLALAKQMLANVDTTNGWDSESNRDVLQQAIKTYDVCVSVHGLDPFMSSLRSVKPAKVSPLVNIIGNNTNTVAIIVIISMVSVTAIGGYFFLRKRKEN